MLIAIRSGSFQRVLHALLSSKLIINVRKTTAATWISPSTLADPLDDSNLRASRLAAMPLEFIHSVELQSRHTTCKCLECGINNFTETKLIASIDVESKSEAWSVNQV